MVIDASWDYENIKNDQLYSEYIHQIWKSKQTVVTPKPPSKKQNERNNNFFLYGKYQNIYSRLFHS